MLTEEQRDLVANNHNLIYWFAHNKNLNLGEYYDVLAIALCKAARRFDPSLGFSFTTYAYKCMMYECIKIWRNESSARRTPGGPILSYDAPIGSPEDGMTLLDVISNSSDIGYDFDSKAETEDFIKTLTDKQTEIIENLLYYGSDTDAAQNIGCTRQNISIARRSLQNRWRKYNAE